MSKQLYAAGSIVEAIEAHQTLRNVGVGPVRIITVTAINPFGMKLITQHHGEVSAEIQRREYRQRGYTDIT